LDLRNFIVERIVPADGKRVSRKGAAMRSSLGGDLRRVHEMSELLVPRRNRDLAAKQ
jgi:hypothetical protein